ncbi:MAG: long-chain fatty acid--CoA ligase [Actinomycetota bacterium]|jgi:acyl-CoA synthetase (AMP-forming)/AMP-acid ligase II|nr:long-chain fatty acid--CoA ligase [Actinomycetota bacterium]
MDRGIGSWVTKRAFLGGDRTALVFGEARLTYLDLDRRTDQLARGLRELGVRRGDRVAALVVNSPAFLETMLATAKLGAVFVPMNLRLTAGEVGYLLADSGADVIVSSAPLTPVARAALAEPGVRVRTRLVAAVDGPRVDLEPGELDFEQLVIGHEARPLGTDVDGGDLSMLMYTSGTTGHPKGAMLTHDNHLWNALNTLSVGRGLRESDVTVTVAPMFHIGGLGVHTLPLLYVGGTNVLMAAFDPARTLAAMARERATVQFMVPAMWAALTTVRDFDSYDLSALELAVSGGAPCPLTVIDFFAGKGLPFQEGFGMTETAPLVSVLDIDHVKEKAGSIGRTVFHVEARIVDEDDRDVPVDQVGELVLRGRNLFVGYWGLPEATAEAFRGGWFHTGDLGRIDGSGFITLVDRKKDMIISGGENVYPIEVEQVLYRHEAVREVAVIGVPDQRWGETPLAIVALAPGAAADPDALIAYTRERLAHFKCPTRVELLDELPRNATGKILKTELRRRYGGDARALQR